MLVFGSMFGVKLTNLTVTQFFDPSILTTILSPGNLFAKFKAQLSCEEVTGRSAFGLFWSLCHRQVKIDCSRVIRFFCQIV